jgi:hypothetical protein
MQNLSNSNSTHKKGNHSQDRDSKTYNVEVIFITGINIFAYRRSQKTNYITVNNIQMERKLLLRMHQAMKDQVKMIFQVIK